MGDIDRPAGLVLSDRVDQALDAAGLAWWEWDCASGRLQSSRGHASMFGRDPNADACWQDVIAAVRPADADAVAQAMQSLLDGRANDYRVRYSVERQGVIRRVQDTGRVTSRTADGRPATVTGVAQDITEHERLEAARATSERNLVHAEAFARFGHWSFSLDDRVMYASAGAMRIYGVDTPHVALERAQAFVVAADRPQLDSALRALITEGIPYDIEFEIKRSSDEAIVAVHSRAEFDPRARRVFGVIQDITERKRGETEREALIEQLRKAIERIKTLDGIVPICSNCKKIRDDKGYWEQVEAYVSRHTDAQFSHGICPDCAARLYPGL